MYLGKVVAGDHKYSSWIDHGDNHGHTLCTFNIETSCKTRDTCMTGSGNIIFLRHAYKFAIFAIKLHCTIEDKLKWLESKYLLVVVDLWHCFYHSIWNMTLVCVV